MPRTFLGARIPPLPNVQTVRTRHNVRYVPQMQDRRLCQPLAHSKPNSPCGCGREPSIPTWIAEYRFHPDRRWRFDFAWPNERIAVEIEGITHYGAGIGRHQSAKGFVADCEKYEAALLDGWRVYRIPGPWIREGNDSVWRPQVIDTLKQLLGVN